MLRMILNFIRNGLGMLIRFVDWITRGRPIERSREDQGRVDSETQGWALYEFQNCPFCIKTRRAIHRLGLKIEMRDCKKNPTFESELVTLGGELQVPCLRIPAHGDQAERWMYESSEIIVFLEKKFLKQPSL
jgi:glutaredoxin